MTSYSPNVDEIFRRGNHVMVSLTAGGNTATKGRPIKPLKERADALREFLEKTYPGVFFSMTLYISDDGPGCYTDIVLTEENWNKALKFLKMGKTVHIVPLVRDADGKKVSSRTIENGQQDDDFRVIF